MKYLAFVVACLLALTLAQPASADADPVQVGLPEFNQFNPEHTPYEVQVQDPAPERGDLVAAWAGRTLVLPHDGSATIPFAATDGDTVTLRVLRCATADDCVETGWSRTVYLVNEIRFSLPADDRALGEHSAVPLGGFYDPYLMTGEVVDLTWELEPVGGGAAIATGSGSYAVGDTPPLVGVPAAPGVDRGVLTVHAAIDSETWGHLEGVASATYDLDTDAPPLSLRLSGDVLFPAQDDYLDQITIGVRSASDVRALNIVLVAPDGTTRHIFSNDQGFLRGYRFTGLYGGKRLPTGRYTVRATVTDRAGNTTVSERPLTIDDRRAVRKSYRATISAARTVADTYVGACSRLGAAAGRGWKGSLGLYSTSPCAQENGSVVVTVNGAWLPPSVLPYRGDVHLSMYGGAARGSGRAYIVHGWLRASNGNFFGRRQFTGALGSHSASVRPKYVVRTIDGNNWVYWQLGLSEGSHYDVKSFTIRCQYYALESPRSRTASDAKTIAEPSGAPGPGYTVPKTDAAELPAAYSPGM